ncbi:uncharacterized protein LOC112177452 [Rosa chinensis]|uniref:uncharacterized protein LOC112177452 n=1 Tax=Rosa chinensis TaxID=74649 RepID=UPI000D097928|nr:uncharacterized protein LOC112177452 [Rosa chinensis]
MALAAFKQGLLKGAFLYHLNYKHPKAAYDHVMSEAVIYAQAEFITYRETLPPLLTLAKSTQPSSSHQETLTRPLPRRKLIRRESGNMVATRASVQGSNSATTPRKYPRVSKPRNTGKWCKYHEDSGHNTNNCNALKTVIETLYRDGKMEQFKVRQPPPVITNIEPMGRSNTIDGGTPITNMSHRAKKRYARANHPKEVCNIRYERSAKLPKSGWAPFSFSEEEESGVHLPHDDPFLIDIVPDRWSVGRVLVDSGSAVNVIFNGCYNKLQWNRKLL